MSDGDVLALAIRMAGDRMTDDEPPWREVTRDTYDPRRRDPSLNEGHVGYLAMQAEIRDLLTRQLAGEFRIRLVLREAHDLAGSTEDAKRRQNPYSDMSYAIGDDAILLCASAVVIERQDGTRYPGPMGRHVAGAGWANGGRGGLKPGRWTTEPLKTRYGYAGPLG